MSSSSTRENIISKWDRRYQNPDLKPKACEILTLYPNYLPSQGRALDLACGLGGNAIYLAQHNLKVCAWDISQQAIKRLKAAGHDNNIRPEARDVIANPPQANSFDVIVVSYFLQAEIFPALKSALRQGGILYYQTHDLNAADYGGPKNPDYLLKDRQLIMEFSGFEILQSFERNHSSPLSQGQSALIARRN